MKTKTNKYEYIKFNKDIKLLLWTILSSLLHALSLSNFSIPGKLYPGGFAGIARITSDILTDFFHFSNMFSVIYFLLNITMALIVFKYIGKRFTIYSLIHISLTSIITPMIKPFFIVDDILLISVFGGIISGFAIGLALEHNSSSGGTDFLAIYLANKYHKQTWNIVLYLNTIVLLLAGLIYGWERALYSIILQFCSTQVVKRMHKRYVHQTITIITEKKDEVIESLFSNAKHGVTEIKAKGAYLKKDESILYTVVNAFETQSVCMAVLKVDPKAFINIQDSKNIVGNFYQKPLD